MGENIGGNICCIGLKQIFFSYHNTIYKRKNIRIKNSVPWTTQIRAERQETDCKKII